MVTGCADAIFNLHWLDIPSPCTRNALHQRAPIILSAIDEPGSGHDGVFHASAFLNEIVHRGGELATHVLECDGMLGCPIGEPLFLGPVPLVRLADEVGLQRGQAHGEMVERALLLALRAPTQLLMRRIVTDRGRV
ncbi:BQ5605_C001g00410 [Microbotryum silenes-dioicae]|uniref:BQ5605_C001g00410 protein n=1 Tax=Microbotryum silenes-dioicae TaxID=796604 RepID=A0A2X0M3A4_9BASI|nr:BQ5605_C001g00410 [Microbotryum silenes-dioicae]